MEQQHVQLCHCSYVLSIIFGQKQEECVLTPELISGAKSWCFHKQIHIYCLEGAPQKGPRQQLSRHLPGADDARCVCQNNQKKIREAKMEMMQTK